MTNAVKWFFIFLVLTLRAQIPPEPAPPCTNCVIEAQKTYLDFDPDRRVPLDVNPLYTYNLWQWAFQPNTNQIFRYTNGVLDALGTEPNGTANINLVSAWIIQPDANSVLIGVIDDFIGTHGNFVFSIVQQITRSTNILKFQTDFSRQQSAEAFTNAVNAGCQIINYSSGDVNNPKPTNLLASIWRAYESNVLVCVPALNGYGPEDNSQDWIAIEHFPHVLVVSSFDKSGNLWQSAYGTNVFISAPGRRVLVFDGTNAFSSSGACHATAHVSGVSALCMARYSEEDAGFTITRLREGADKSASFSHTNSVGGTLNAYRALVWNPYLPYLTIDSANISLSVPTNFPVNLFYSEDLLSWTAIETNLVTDGFPHPVAQVGSDKRFWKLQYSTP